MMDKFQDAINSYNKSVELDPKYVDAYVELSSVYQKIGNKAEAGNNVGLYYFWKEQYEKAAKAFDDVVKAHPNHAVAFNNLAVCYDKLGNRDLSLANLKKSASLGYSPAIEICKKNNIIF
jgi:tetratricopeptide (TPR) repeat protein